MNHLDYISLVLKYGIPNERLINIVENLAYAPYLQTSQESQKVQQISNYGFLSSPNIITPFIGDTFSKLTNQKLMLLHKLSSRYNSSTNLGSQNPLLNESNSIHQVYKLINDPRSNHEKLNHPMRYLHLCLYKASKATI